MITYGQKTNFDVSANFYPFKYDLTSLVVPFMKIPTKCLDSNPLPAEFAVHYDEMQTTVLLLIVKQIICHMSCTFIPSQQ